MQYDSKKDTQEHIENVRKLLYKVVSELCVRYTHHDDSKLEEPEISMYDKFTPKLRTMTYGSDEYKECLKQMGPALKHHYENNSHHPEHYPNGVNGMSLLDLIEMLADWKAAGMRHADGNMQQSLEVNKQRFGMSDQLAEIFQNTVKELDW
jgi:hypothetical protein